MEFVVLKVTDWSNSSLEAATTCVQHLFRQQANTVCVRILFCYRGENESSVADFPSKTFILKLNRRLFQKQKKYADGGPCRSREAEEAQT